jgi:pyridoxine/pyridoxamine 5'-phosphate oxidase
LRFTALRIGVMSHFDERKSAPIGRDLPGFYNDLDASLEHAWAMLVRGGADRRAAFHTPVVATIDEDGAPSQRVMVLRAADPALRSLRLHTDLRSDKLRHVGRDARVALNFYDVAAKLQLRVMGSATAHAGDEIARAAWKSSRPQSRLCYEQHEPPGSVIVKPLAELPVDRRFAEADDGLKNFAALVVEVSAVEWLYLAIEGHRRARWKWNGNAWEGTWLAP